MWDVGAAVGRIELDTSNYDANISKVQKKNESLTGSFFKAQVAFEVFKKAVGGVADYLKDSVKSFAAQEVAEAKLSIQIKGSINTYKEFASQIQKTTTVGDEAILGAMALAKSMGVADDKLKETTKGAVGLSEAFGVDLNQATKLATLAGQGNYDMLSRYIPALKTVNTEAEKQAIVQQAMASGFAQAEAKGDTFTGKLMQWKNASGDIQEEFGRIISVIGKDFIQVMIDGANKITEFITSVKGIEVISNIWGGIGGGFEIVKTVFNDIYQIISGKIIGLIKQITEKFTTLFDKTKTGNFVFFLLAGAVKTVGIAFEIVINCVKGFINIILNFIKIIKESIGVFATFGQALLNPFSKEAWNKVGEQVGKTWEAIKITVSDFVNDVKSNFVDTWNSIKNLPEDTKKMAEKMGEAWNEGFKKAKSKMQIGLTTQGGTDTAISGEGQGAGEAKSDIVSKTEKDLNVVVSLYEGASNSISNTVGKMGNSIASGMINVVNSIKKGAEDIGQAVNSVAETFANVFQSSLDVISSAMDSYFENELSKLEEYSEARLEKLEEQKEIDLENLESQIEEEAEVLNQKYENGLISKTMYDEGIAELEKRSANEREKIEKEYNKKIEKEKERAAKKQDQIAQKQFEANKATTIASIWIQAALGMVSAWASLMQTPGGIAGIALAAAISALITGIAIAQTAVVASQQYVPMKERGGAASGWVSMNERGGELAYLPDGSVIVPHDLSTQIASSVVSEKTVEKTNNNPILIQLTLNDKVLDEILLDKQALEAIR